MTEGIAEIKQFQSPRKTMKFTLKPCLKPGILSTTAYFLNLIFSANLRSSKQDYDAMCSLANYIIYRAVQNYKKAYITSLSLVPLLPVTTVSTSIRFPRSSLPRLVNLAHTAVLECCTKFSTRVLNLVPLLNLAPLNLVSLTWYSSTTTSTGGPL